MLLNLNDKTKRQKSKLKTEKYAEGCNFSQKI